MNYKKISPSSTILIIGASGFIGANVFNYFKDRNVKVYGTYSSSKNLWRLKSKNLIHLDLSDISQFKKVFYKIKPDYIINCSSYGAYSFETDFENIHNINYLSLIKVFEFLKNETFSLFINCGSSSEYGLNAAGPLENDLKLPNSHYSLSKISLSYAINYFYNIYKIPLINLRLYYVYGPYEDSSRLLPTIFNFGIKKKLPKFANKNDVKDFIYIDDLASAFEKIIINHKEKHYGKSFNLGTGVKTKLIDVVNLSKKYFKLNIIPNFSSANSRKWDVNNWFSDSSSFKKEFKWEPKVSFSEGIEKTFDWWSNFTKKNNTNLQLLSKYNFNIEQKKTISAVICCYKDGEAIPFMYQRLVKVFKFLNVNYEIIFVNDNSPDNSISQIKKISSKDSNVIGINHSRNFGSQASLFSGLKVSRGDAVVLLDGDLQDPPELIKDFYKKWMEGYEVVYGIRAKRDAPIIFSFFIRQFYKLFSYLSEFHIPRDAGDFSLIDKKVVKHILQFNECDLFLRGLRAYVGFRQTGVSYFRPERMFGKSTNNFLKNIEWAKKGIFSFSVIPLKIFSFLGVFLIIASLILSIILVIQKIFFIEQTIEGFTFISLLILFLGSVLILGIGILSEYIAILLKEVKNRHLYIINSKIYNGTIHDE